MQIEADWKRNLVLWLWLSVGFAAIGAIMFLFLFEGAWRLLAAVPFGYGIGAYICAVELREVEHPTRMRWILSLIFAAWPILVLFGGGLNKLTGAE